MDYELAKQLKDAGFPQSKCTYEICAHGMSSKYVDFNEKGICREGLVGLPILEELIEACGEKFQKLIKNHLPDSKHAWIAISYPLDIEGLGSTPSESVARLWMALNKKS